MMEWYVLVLMLSLPTLSQADCSAQCLRCAQQIPDLDTALNRLTCTLECEGAVLSSGTLDRCEKVLRELSDELADLDSDDDGERSALNVEDLQDKPYNLVKRYGGFIKRIDKNKNKNFASPWKENAILKGLFLKKYGESLSKLSERDVPSFTEDDEGDDITAENETGLYDNEVPLNEVKRYGGFLRKFGPKRSDLVDNTSRQVLQKRYGGFMRRIRPKLRWDNQKRYGGFLRRHFKISVRSDEEPSSHEDYAL
ncbi:proenkephalin-B [Pimephales promelas]|uniref:proenkephalin-B n=1 Tax=Pimephales promelas TaxID=90988 RepID=UPI00195567E3|nr:proenkephalin-B [Pimephales promelas]XP_039508746.1 proenkephalin-B [Pimephales promelas]XP_039508747.1 proenkephalin-B [Pimephales promelas]KAG1960672.1 proenkephalin-B [Pimephales promelas]